MPYHDQDDFSYCFIVHIRAIALIDACALLKSLHDAKAPLQMMLIRLTDHSEGVSTIES